MDAKRGRNTGVHLEPNDGVRSRQRGVRLSRTGWGLVRRTDRIRARSRSRKETPGNGAQRRAVLC